MYGTLIIPFELVTAVTVAIGSSNVVTIVGPVYIHVCSVDSHIHFWHTRNLLFRAFASRRLSIVSSVNSDTFHFCVVQTNSSTKSIRTKWNKNKTKKKELCPFSISHFANRRTERKTRTKLTRAYADKTHVIVFEAVSAFVSSALHQYFTRASRDIFFFIFFSPLLFVVVFVSTHLFITPNGTWTHGTHWAHLSHTHNLYILDEEIRKTRRKMLKCHTASKTFLSCRRSFGHSRSPATHSLSLSASLSAVIRWERMVVDRGAHKTQLDAL